MSKKSCLISNIEIVHTVVIHPISLLSGRITPDCLLYREFSFEAETRKVTIKRVKLQRIKLLVGVLFGLMYFGTTKEKYLLLFTYCWHCNICIWIVSKYHVQKKLNLVEVQNLRADSLLSPKLLVTIFRNLIKSRNIVKIWLYFETGLKLNCNQIDQISKYSH